MNKLSIRTASVTTGSTGCIIVHLQHKQSVWIVDFVLLSNLPYKVIMGIGVINGLNMVIYEVDGTLIIDGISVSEIFRITKVKSKMRFLSSLKSCNIYMLSGGGSSEVIESMV